MALMNPSKLTCVLEALPRCNLSYSKKEVISTLILRYLHGEIALVKHGRWVGSGQWNHKPYRMKNKEKWQTYLCSECGHSNGRRFNDNYCPNCGAKMDWEEPWV